MVARGSGPWPDAVPTSAPLPPGSVAVQRGSTESTYGANRPSRRNAITWRAHSDENGMPLCEAGMTR
jgi:hypothetical protein